jgi:hypothetical protein
MKNPPKPLFWTAALLLLLAGLAMAYRAAAQARDVRAPGAVTPAPDEEEPEEEATEPGFRSALDIRLQSQEGNPYPPGELVLSNPFGESEGYDPRSRTNYQEIPGASYKLEPVPDSPESQAAALYVRNPVSGTYTLRVIGVESGNYGLFMKGFDRYRSHVNVQFIARIKAGQIHHYRVNYSNKGGTRLDVRRTQITR